MENDSKTGDFGPPPQHGSIWPRIWRGMKLRCPRCGAGKLFQSYLTPVAHCSNCGQEWGHVRADLAPAWAAMTLAAHLTVGIWHFFFWKTEMPSWQLTLIRLRDRPFDIGATPKAFDQKLRTVPNPAA